MILQWQQLTDGCRRLEKLLSESRRECSCFGFSALQKTNFKATATDWLSLQKEVSKGARCKFTQVANIGAVSSVIRGHQDWRASHVCLRFQHFNIWRTFQETKCRGSDKILSIFKGFGIFSIKRRQHWNLL